MAKFRPKTMSYNALPTKEVVEKTMKALKERGYAGKYYQTHGVANNDFLRVGGKDIEGSFLPVGPVVVAKDLPDSNPIKKVSLDFTKKYEDANGKGSMNSFAGHGRLRKSASVQCVSAPTIALCNSAPA